MHTGLSSGHFFFLFLQVMQPVLVRFLGSFLGFPTGDRIGSLRGRPRLRKIG